MNIKSKYTYTESYLPTPRHRKLRYREAENTLDVAIVELNEQDAPVAFIVTEYEGKSTEYRLYNDNLYIKVLWSERYSGATGLYPLDEFVESVENYTRSIYIYREKRTEERVQQEIRQYADKHIIIDKVVWEIKGEPLYVINTFGMENNHGGTGLFIENCYNPNISSDSYFNALERDKAIEYGKNVALRRGDTESVDRIGLYYNIEVLIPEAVKCNPQKKVSQEEKI